MPSTVEVKIDESITFQQFRSEWIADNIPQDASSVDKGHRFAHIILTQWLDVGDLPDEPVYCDGSGDGGIDIAVLVRSEDADDTTAPGDTWFLVQSKYGSAFAGAGTLLEEGVKVLETLERKRAKLSSLASGLLERLTNFLSSASENDRMVLVYATVDPLDETEKRILNDVRAAGRERLGPIFDVATLSLETIFATLQSELKSGQSLALILEAELTPSSDDLLVGTVGLMALYQLLKTYRIATEDLDRIYEKNVRRFLGGTGKVNKAMQQTLRGYPERFGLYNNGITIVVEDFEALGDKKFKLIEPYIVNGCQTTRTIWDVFYSKLESGGTGADPELEEWKSRAQAGVVIAKIVKVGAAGEDLLEAITRYTNSQNPIRDKDFVALNSDFRTWYKVMADKYDIYLEIQRGGWESRKALQKQKPEARQFKRMANAFDLIKVYGSGWLGEIGAAFGRNAYFTPGGSVFKRIMSPADTDAPFEVEDLYACYLLMQAAEELKFGRGAEKDSRRQSKFLFYYVTAELIKDVAMEAGVYDGRRSISKALIKILGSTDSTARNALIQPAVGLIDSYFLTGSPNNIYVEPAFATMNSNLNGFLKWEQIGKGESTPKLSAALSVTRMSMVYGESPPREVLLKLLKSGSALAQEARKQN